MVVAGARNVCTGRVTNGRDYTAVAGNEVGKERGIIGEQNVKCPSLEDGNVC